MKSVTRLWRFVKPYGRSAGRLSVRLASLVQFDEYLGDRADCWALDVETEAAPKDPDYPWR